MAYDGFYGNLSARGSSNEIVNQALRIKAELEPIPALAQAAVVDAEAARDAARQSQLIASTAASQTALDSAEAVVASLDAKRYADAATYKFQTFSTAATSIVVGANSVFPIVTSTLPAVVYQIKSEITLNLGPVLYDVEVSVGGQLIYKSESISTTLVDSIPFFTERVGQLNLKITNRGRADFTVLSTVTLSQVGNL